MMMLKIYVELYSHDQWQIQMQALTYGYQDFLVPDGFQKVMAKLVQGMEYVKTTILP
jgi:hypothetical protein